MQEPGVCTRADTHGNAAGHHPVQRPPQRDNCPEEPGATLQHIPYIGPGQSFVSSMEDLQQRGSLQHPMGDPQQHPMGDPQLHPTTDLQEQGSLQSFIGHPQEQEPLQHPMGDLKAQRVWHFPTGNPQEKPHGDLRLQLAQPGLPTEGKGLNVSGQQGDPHCLGCHYSATMEQEDAQEDVLQKKLSVLHLDEPQVKRSGFSFNKGREMRPFFNNHDVRLHFPDIRYPEPLATEESPRRRSRSLPWNTIPEVDVEEEDDSIMCCCKLKKKVQFADSLGLTLASVKHFLPSEDPLVPQAVLARLQSYPPTMYGQRTELILEDELASSNLAEPMPAPAELLERINEHGVCLEQVSASSLGVRGYVLVKELGETAQVKIRYTFNEWLSFLDCPATLVGQSATPLSAGCQRFHFNLCYPPSTSCIHFAICFSTGPGQEMWDNNKGANYTVTCKQDPLPEIQQPGPEYDEWEGSLLW